LSSRRRKKEEGSLDWFPGSSGELIQRLCLALPTKIGGRASGILSSGRACEPVQIVPDVSSRDRKHPCIATNQTYKKLANTENIAVQLPNVLLAATSQSASV
jgi:hypothetical protein